MYTILATNSGPYVPYVPVNANVVTTSASHLYMSMWLSVQCINLKVTCILIDYHSRGPGETSGEYLEGVIMETHNFQALQAITHTMLTVVCNNINLGVSVGCTFSSCHCLLLVTACLLCSYSSLTLGLEQMWEEAKPGTEDIRWWIWALDAEIEQGQCQLCVERYHIYTHDCYQNVTEHTVYKIMVMCMQLLHVLHMHSLRLAPQCPTFL